MLACRKLGQRQTGYYYLSIPPGSCYCAPMICALTPPPPVRPSGTRPPCRWCPRNDAGGSGNYFTTCSNGRLSFRGDDGVCYLNCAGDDVGAVALNQHLDDTDWKNAAARIAVLQCPVGGIQQVAEGALDRVIGMAIPLGGKQAIGEFAPSWFDSHGDVSLWLSAAAVQITIKL